MSGNEKTRKEKQDIGYPKEWLISVLEQEVEKPITWTEKTTDAIGPTKPKSRIQELLQDIYHGLLEARSAQRVKIHIDPDGASEVINLPEEDFFDKWYENNGLKNYNQKYRLMSILNSIAQEIGKTGEGGYGEQEFQSILSKLTNAVLEEDGGIIAIASAINRRYRGLAELPMRIPDPEEVNEHNQLLYERELGKIRQSVESNIDQYEGLLQDLESAAKTDFEQMASILNHIIIFGEAMWELILYSVMSPRAPRLIINNLDYRANLHVLLPGDISTAKSKILEICKIISPKMLIVDETTKANLEGVFKIGEDEIAEGVLDMAQRGNIIIEELTKRFTNMPLWRRAMDCKFIQIFKGGKSKGMTVNTTVLAACNPDADFFQEEDYFREQIAFKEGILSRFDIIIPLTATTTANAILIDKMNLFGEAVDNVDFNDFKRKLTLIAVGMDNIKRVKITPVQLEMIRDVVKEHNETDHRRRILRNRPLILLRDLETLARFVNVIAAVNFTKRTVENGILYADDEDIERAIRLWENLLHMRVQLYGGQNRILKSTADEIVLYIINAMKDSDREEVSLLKVKEYIVDDRRLISKATFYREVEKLRDSGRIIQSGKRNAKVKVIIA